MLTSLSGPVQAQQEFDRTVLPIPDPVYEPITELDARNTEAPPPFSVMAPNGAVGPENSSSFREAIHPRPTKQTGRRRLA